MTTEGSINLAGDHQAARLLFKRLGAHAGAGVTQLVVTVELASRKAAADHQPLWIGGDVYAMGVGRGSGYLGRLHTQIQPVTLPERGGTHDVSLAVDLSYAQLQEIENHRTGSVRLAFDFAGNWLVAGVPQPFWAVRLEYELKQSEWIVLLEQMQFRRIMLIELDALDGEVSTEYADAMRYFSNAQKHYLEHDWRLTVESLRQALAAIVGKEPDEEDTEAEVRADFKAVRGQAGRAGYHERYLLVRQAAKFMCDLGAHPETAGTAKQDAYAALLVTAGLLHGLVHG